MHVATLLALIPLALAAPAKRAEPAPVLVPRNAQLVRGKYIVKMKSESRIGSVAKIVAGIDADAEHTYTRGFRGFAARLTPQELQKLRDHPDVDYIEQDSVISISATQHDATWGIARISSEKPGASSYTYDDSAGEGTCAYIIDTGIQADHPEFEGRAKFAANFADKDDVDGHGHGTHVAGTIGSKTYGVAKKTTLFGVKVLDENGSGETSVVLAGMDFVAKHAANQTVCPKGVVVNMSLGGSKSDTVNEAAAAITRAGIFLAVAAGNDGEDASEYSPASEKSACTVGATTANDTLASYSNRGDVVDVLAPGTGITSTWRNGGTKKISGTSMASPHVAGIAAYFLGLGQKVDGLCEYIAKQAQKGAVGNVPDGTVNLIIHNGEK